MKKGFTLLEILLVIASIGILAAIVIVAINPQRQLAQVRNGQRESAVREIFNAIEQYLIDNGEYPAGITGGAYQEICSTGASDCSGLLDLSLLTPTYLAQIPVNPGETESNQTGYEVGLNEDVNKVSVRAQADFEELGSVIAINLIEGAGSSGSEETFIGIDPIADLVVGTSGTDFTLSWSAPNDNGLGISDYKVLYSTDGFSSDSRVFLDGGGTTPSATVSGLLIGQQYDFAVRSVNPQGESPNSNIDSATISTAICDTDHGGSDFTPGNGDTLTGIHCNINNFVINNGDTVNITNESRVVVNAASISVAGTLNGDGRGFAGGALCVDGSGPGGGDAGNQDSRAGGGGAYGSTSGTGYDGQSLGYGPLLLPSEFGSGGAGGGEAGCDRGDSQGGAGGGSIELVSTGGITVDGSIQVNGTDGQQVEDSNSGNSGGGSGGSIVLNGQSISGTGQIIANGGNGSSGAAGNNGGGGSGGRMHLISDSALGGSLTTSAYGGQGHENGGAGTVLVQNSSNGNLAIEVDNNQVGLSPATNIGNVQGEFSDQSVTELVVTGNAYVIGENTANTINTLIVSESSNAEFSGSMVTESFSLNDTSTLSIAGTFENGNGISVSSGNSLFTDSDVSSTVNPYNIDVAGVWEYGANIIGTLQDITIQNGGRLSHYANGNNSIDLSVNGNIQVASGGQINVEGRGSAGGADLCDNGSGTAGGEGGDGNADDTAGAGGAYGGDSGDGDNVGSDSFGDIMNPTSHGSGGGAGGENGCNQGLSSGGAGGGIVRLTSGGSVTVDGQINANGGVGTGDGVGGSGNGGGGSGGSVYLEASSVEGSGTIIANGGVGATTGSGPAGGGGSGGRIAIVSPNISLPTGNINAQGGASSFSGGGAGTVAIEDTDDGTITLKIQNGGVATTKVTTVGGVKGVYSPNSITTFDYGSEADFLLRKAISIGGSDFTIPTGSTVYLEEVMTFTDNPNVNILGALEIEDNFTGAINNLTVSGTITHYDNQASYIDIAAGGDINLQNTSVINLDERGFNGGEFQCEDGSGPGGGLHEGSSSDDLSGGGAGYGGAGGAGDGAGGSAYGSSTSPDQFGSGGASGEENGCNNGNGSGGDGGGRIRLNGANVTLDGVISVNGGTFDSDGSGNVGNGGGGSGGSIWVTGTGSITGAGALSANGGAGSSTAVINAGGGGAGGRIYLETPTNSFSGTTSVNGGAGLNPGATGTSI